MPKIVLYIAMSLDGYIADKNNGVDWLVGQDPHNTNMGSYPDFLKTIDRVILGYTTYQQIITELSPDKWVYAGMKSYVLTHREVPSQEEITFTNMDIAQLTHQLKQEKGKDIWLCGGANIVSQFIKLDLIDRYHITLIPTLLGGGVPLFQEMDHELRLKLIDTSSSNGMVDLIYEKRI